MEMGHSPQMMSGERGGIDAAIDGYLAFYI